MLKYAQKILSDAIIIMLERTMFLATVFVVSAV